MDKLDELVGTLSSELDIGIAGIIDRVVSPVPIDLGEYNEVSLTDYQGEF